MTGLRKNAGIPPERGSVSVISRGSCTSGKVSFSFSTQGRCISITRHAIASQSARKKPTHASTGTTHAPHGIGAWRNPS